MANGYSDIPNNATYQIDNINRKTVLPDPDSNQDSSILADTVKDTDNAEEYIVFRSRKGITAVHRVKKGSNNKNNYQVRRYTDSEGNNYLVAVADRGISITQVREQPLFKTIYGFPINFVNQNGVRSLQAYGLVTPNGVTAFQLFNGAGHAIDYMNDKDKDMNNHMQDPKPFNTIRNPSTPTGNATNFAVKNIKGFSTTVDEVKNGYIPTVEIETTDKEEEDDE